MATTGGSTDGMYSKLMDDSAYDELIQRPDVGQSAHLPVSPVRVTPRPGGPGPYRLATFCLAALCGVLLISIIAVSANNKNKPAADADATAEVQKQRQDVNVSSLMNSITKLQKEKDQLRQEKDQLKQEKDQLKQDKDQLKQEKDQLKQEKDQLKQEKDQLQAKLDARDATKAPDRIKPTTSATAPPIVCPVDWHLFNGSCYFVSRNTRDWPESKSYCESQGGHLAIIHTAEEQTFVWNLLPRGHWNAFWFGITDEHTEDHWKWVDGTPLVGGFWEEGEPNNHIDEDCGYIVKTRVLERVPIRSWYDAPCSMYWRFICEKEAGGGGASTGVPH